jgi:hypothetical protein
MTTAILDDVRANERAYDSLRAELERTHWAQWVVIVRGQLVAVAPTREEALQQAGKLPPTAASRLVRQVGEELPKRAPGHH